MPSPNIARQIEELILQESYGGELNSEEIDMLRQSLYELADLAALGDSDAQMELYGILYDALPADDQTQAEWRRDFVTPYEAPGGVGPPGPSDFERTYGYPPTEEDIIYASGNSGFPSLKASTAQSLEEKIAEREALLGRQLTQRELLGLMNLPQPLTAPGSTRVTTSQRLAEIESSLGRPLTDYERTRLSLGFDPGGGTGGFASADMRDLQYALEVGLIDESQFAAAASGALGLGGSSSGWSSADRRDLDYALSRGLINADQYNQALAADLGIGGGSSGLSPYQQSQLDLSRQNFEESRRQFDARMELERQEAVRRAHETQIQAARSSNPLTYLSLMRGPAGAVSASVGGGGGGGLSAPGGSGGGSGGGGGGGVGAGYAPNTYATRGGLKNLTDIENEVNLGAAAGAARLTGQAALEEYAKRRMEETPYQVYGEVYKGLHRLVPPLELSNGLSGGGSGGGGGVPGGPGWNAPDLPPGLSDVNAGRGLRAPRLPQGILRPPSATSQANMMPSEKAAMMEAVGFQTGQEADYEDYLGRVRRGYGPGLRTAGYAGIGVRR